MLYNPLYPYSHADIDREIVGENAGLECKTMTMPFAENDLENGNYPPVYYVQCLHYMAITGADRWYLAILLLGHGLYIFTIERSKEIENMTGIMQAETDFWVSHVLTDAPPPPDGMEATTNALNSMYSESDAYDTELEDEPLQKYEILRKQAEEIKRQMEQIKQSVMLVMQESESGVSDSYRVFWKKRKRTSCNFKKLANAYPDIDFTPFIETTEYRQFSVK